MSTNPEKKALNKQIAADKAQARADLWKAKAGQDDEVAVEEIEAAPSLEGLDLVPNGIFTRVVITLANGQNLEFLVPNVEQYRELHGKVAKVAKTVIALQKGVKKGMKGLQKKAMTFMDAWEDLSATVDRLKAYHDDLDGNLKLYEADGQMMYDLFIDTFGDSIDIINRLDTANTGSLVLSRGINALGKATANTPMGSLLFKGAALAAKLYAYSTSTGSALAADEDALELARRQPVGSSFLDRLFGRVAANAPGPAPATTTGTTGRTSNLR